MDFAFVLERITPQDMEIVKSWTRQGFKAKALKPEEVRTAVLEEFIGWASALKTAVRLFEMRTAEHWDLPLANQQLAVLEKYAPFIEVKLPVAPDLPCVRNDVELLRKHLLSVHYYTYVLNNIHLKRQYLHKTYGGVFETRQPPGNVHFFKGAIKGFSDANRLAHSSYTRQEILRQTKELLLCLVTYIAMMPP